MFDEVHHRETDAEYRQRVYVVIADQTGHVAVLALTELFRMLGII